jgi:hypothetical protein
MVKQCKHCSIGFVDGSRSKTRQFCSKECKNKSWYLFNREHAIARCLAYEAANKGIIKERKRKYVKNRRLANINFRVASNLRSRISMAVMNNFKHSTLSEYLGCSISELKIYLESKFKPNMTWENYGEWEIDHIYPLAKADLTDRETFMRVCHHSNLQPLWKSENRSKKDRI